MTESLDRDLALLARSRTPSALDMLEPQVLQAIETGGIEGAALSLRAMAFAGGAALMLGIVGGGAVAGRIEARERPVAVVALDARLAPSTLLLGR